MIDIAKKTLRWRCKHEEGNDIIKAAAAKKGEESSLQTTVIQTRLREAGNHKQKG